MSSVDLAHVFRAHGPAYRQAVSLPLRQLRAMWAIEHCRTAALGGHLEACDGCGHQRNAGSRPAAASCCRSASFYIPIKAHRQFICLTAYELKHIILRVQSGGRPLRIFYAFDPKRLAILLIGGDKTGDDRFYEKYVPIADRLWAVYLDETDQR